MSQKIIIASQNPVKIHAVELGVSKMFPDESFTFQGVSVDSNVSIQPMGDEETRQGALNRALNAQKITPESDYWVGIEGGVEKQEYGMGVFAWVIILSKTQIGRAKTGVFYLPKKIVELVNAGKELGEANDIVFQNHNSKQKNGAVGLLTHDCVDRTQFYVQTVVLALIPFKNPEIY